MADTQDRYDETRHALATAGNKRRWIIIGIASAAVLGIAVAWFKMSGTPSTAAPGGRGKGEPSGPVPVGVAPVVSQILEHTLTELGTVTARSSVTVRTQVDGQLVGVYFTEGQLVNAGDRIAQIDPRPFEAALSNAKAQLERDDAQLQGALVDLERYRGLIAEDSIPRQQLDTQEALVRQLRGTVNSDKAQIETAQLNLTYSHITAPVSGRIGLRLVDAGNMVHAADTTGLVVITEVQPIDVVFPVPQDSLPDVLRHMRGGKPLVVDAYDRDGKTRLASGKLRSVDNLIDTTTGTVKLKASFENRDLALFPNQFVNVRLHLEAIADALTIPAAAVQRGAPGYYVYKVGSDGTVGLRTPKFGITEGDRIQVLDGLAANDQVVIDGTDKLRDGARIEIVGPAAAGAKPAPADQKPQRKRRD